MSANRIEVEVKAYADGLEPIHEKLRALGAAYVGSVVDEDTYFNHPNRDFARTDEALRVRVNGSRVFVTYKGPKLDKLTKTREELEFELRDSTADLIKAFFKCLGFTEVAHVTKKRDIFNLEGYGITLDDVPTLGTFVEVEARKEGSIEELRDGVLALITRLGLKKTERKSYLELILERSASRSAGTKR